MKLARQVKLALAVCVSAAGLVRAAVVEKPVVMPDAMLSVAVSDLHGLIDGAGGVAAQVSPAMNGMMLKNMIGAQLGDPNLAGIAPGTGLAIVALDQTNVVAFIEVAEAQSAAYAGMVSSTGMKSRYAGGVLVAGSSDALVAKGVEMVPAVKKTLLAKRSPTLRVALQPAALVEKYNGQIQGMLQMMPTMMGMGMQQTPGMDAKAVQNITRILEGELRFILSLAKQCDAAEIVLAPENGSLRIGKTVVAKPGTRLAALLNAPKSGKENPKIQSGVLGEATVSIDGTIGNPEALTAYFVEEIELLAKEMGLKTEEYAGWLDIAKKWMGVYTGSFCETVGLGGDSVFNANYLLEVKDETAALALLKSAEKDMAFFLKLYEELGMPMMVEFKENVREYKGIKIHEKSVGMSMAQMPEEQRIQMEAMGLGNMVCDIAIFDGKMLCAMGGAKIESLIDRVKNAEFKPAPLKARGVYPANGFCYCDIDVAKYLGFVASVMPPEPGNPLPQIAAMLQGSDPVTSAGFREDGMVMWSINVPGSLLGKIGQAVMMAQMQGGAPQAMPVQ